jgi:hypothetical protein
LIYLAYGKPREHVTIEQQDAVLKLEYPTLEEIKADLIANGLRCSLHVPSLCLGF